VVDHIVEPEIAVHHGRAALRRHVVRQPGDEIVHGRNALGLGGAILPRPARDLPLNVVARLAEALEPHSAVINGVQERNDAVELVPDGEALGLCHAGERLIPEHPAVDVIHQVECRADDGSILTQQVRPRHRKAGGMQRAYDGVLPVDGMCRRQQGAGRLAPQHKTPAVGPRHPVGGIRLPAPELLDPERAPEALDATLKVFLQGFNVEQESLLDGFGADELLEHRIARRAHASPARCSGRSGRDGARALQFTLKDICCTA